METKVDIKSNAIINIKDVIQNSSSILNTVGLNEGILGISLFNYYFFLYTENNKYLKSVSFYLEQAFDLLAGGEDLQRFNIFDLVEVGKYLCFLNREGIIDDENVTTYLKELDQPIKNLLQQRIEEKDLDAVGGIIAIGHYLLEANSLLDYQSEIENIVKVINKLSTVKEDMVHWQFTFRDKENPTIESGFFHGISGVLFFLALVFEKEILKNTCEKLIQGGVKFLQSHQNSSGINWFPFDLKTKKELSYQSLVYGDAGIGYAIYRIGTILNNTQYTKMGICILENVAKFRDDDNTFIKDAELIYGSSGLFALFSSLNEQTESKVFEKASSYWFEKTLSYGKNNTPWAGYDTYINGFDEDIQLSFSHGICGIGIVLMAHEMGLDHRKYLSFFNYK